jgi:hypothetical protein
MYAGRHRHREDGRLRRPVARAVVVVAVAAGMSGVGLLAGGRDDPQLTDPPRRPAAAAPAPMPVPAPPTVTAAELRTELRLTGRKRTTIRTALTRIAALTGQLQLSGLPQDPGVLALRTRLRHRDGALAATERRLTRQLATARD